MKNIKNFYCDNNYAIIKAYNKKDFFFLRNFVEAWILNLLKYELNYKKKFSIDNYHNLNIKQKIHNKLFSAKNRHLKINSKLKKILINEKIKNFYTKIAKKKKINFWDEGFGNLAFRIIRPNSTDGYPLEKKKWGPAKGVFSFWIPIYGFSSKSSLCIVKNSHKFEYKKRYFQNSKFQKNEMKLSQKIGKSEFYFPKFNLGDVLIFSDNLLHSERNNISKKTRINLEFRTF